MDEIYDAPVPQAPQPPVEPPPTPQPEPIAPPPASLPAQGSQPVRRVGTFTMGCSLIVVGITVLVAFFGKGAGLATIFRFTPLIFVALGVEVLVASFSQGKKLKYDFLSMVVCGLLVLAALGLSVVPMVMEYVGPEHEYKQEQIYRQLQSHVYGSVGSDEIVEMHGWTNFYGIPASSLDSLTLDTLPGRGHISVTIELQPKYAENADVFAAEVERINKVLSASGAQDALSVNYYTRSGEQEYSVSLNSRYGLSQTAGNIKNLLNREDYLEEKDTRIEELEQERDEKQLKIEEQQEQIDSQQQEINDYQRTIDEQQYTIDEKQRELDELYGRLNDAA